MKRALFFAICTSFAFAPASAQSMRDILNGISRKIDKVASRSVSSTRISSSQRISREPIFGSLDKADIAGVRLGMSPDDVRKALQASGYVIDASKPGYSFRQFVLQKAAKRNPAIQAPVKEQGLRELSGKDSTGQRIDIRFTEMPAGPIVTHIYFTIDDSRTTRASFAQAVREKYGPYTDAQEGMLWYYWCDAGTVNCATRSIGGDFRFLQFTAGPAVSSLELSDVNVTNPIQADLIAKEVDRIAPMQRTRL